MEFQNAEISMIRFIYSRIIHSGKSTSSNKYVPFSSQKGG